MISKVKCPKCNKIHDVEWKVDLSNIPNEMSEANDWSQGIFKCVVFKNPYESKDETRETPTIAEAKRAMRELERDFLNKIINFEKNYRITIQYIETNLTNIPSWKKNNESRTNSVLVYGDINI